MARDSSRNLILRLHASAGVIGAITAFFSRIAPANAATISLTFLLGILGIAATWGLAEAVLASILAMVALNYFFLPPVVTLTISDPHNWAALVAFIITAITASQLSVSARRRAADAGERRREVKRLYDLRQAMLLSGDPRSTAREIVRHSVRIFDIPAAVFYSIEEGGMRCWLFASICPIW